MVDQYESVVASNFASQEPPDTTGPIAISRDSIKAPDTIMPNITDLEHNETPAQGDGERASYIDSSDSMSDGGVEISDHIDEGSRTQHHTDSFNLSLQTEHPASESSPVHLGASVQDIQPFGDSVENFPQTSDLSATQALDLISDFPDGISSAASHDSNEAEESNLGMDVLATPIAVSFNPDAALPMVLSASTTSLQDDEMTIDDEYVSAEPHFSNETYEAYFRYIRDNSSLIVHSDLFTFAQDRRLANIPMSTDDDTDASLRDLRDTEKFYVSDDEFSVGDTTEVETGTRHIPETTDIYTPDPPLLGDGSYEHGMTASALALSTDYSPQFDVVYAQHNNENEVDGNLNNQGGLSMHTETFERNLTVDQFIRQWYLRCRIPQCDLGMMKDPFIQISSEAAHVLDWERPAKISRPDTSRIYDIQGIPWSTKLNVKRSDARALRDRLYTSYHNLKYIPGYYSSVLPEKEGYFSPKTMYTKYRAGMAHFQLRNLMSVTASNTIQYAYQSKVYSITPFYDKQTCLINLSDPSSSRVFFDSVKISTMKAKHGVTMVGGFCGEYAFRGEISDFTVMEGRVTKDPNGITNHIDIIHRRAGPQAVISSNDDRIRTLDCQTNKFVTIHKFARAINCTDTSPDGRLRVIIGDAPDVWIIDSETGKPVQTLVGHSDYGFACAWSPDMLHIATSNQDKTVNIWDARMWRILKSIDSDVAGYRSLRFSPVGGGPRTLLMCEPADRISIVNAQTYQTRQVHDFFGEIGGADYSPDGSRIWVANMDPKFGGFMEFDRREWGQEFGIGHTRKRRIECRGDVYHPDLPNEWVPEYDLDDDARCVLGARERKLRFQKLFNSTQYEMLDPYLG